MSHAETIIDHRDGCGRYELSARGGAALAGMLRTLWRGLRFGGNAVVILALALGLLPLMFGVLCDLVLAPFRWRCAAPPLTASVQQIASRVLHHITKGAASQPLKR